MVIYHTGDLFTLAPKNGLLIHAVNCRGVWGAGIARIFKEKFQDEWQMYSHLTEIHHYPQSSKLLGTSLVVNRVVCLFTSLNYGRLVDIPDQIIENTEKAIIDLLTKTPCTEFHMPKINSGLFYVPWGRTEAVLNKFPDIKFHVYSLGEL